jgi:hypothetical protein
VSTSREWEALQRELEAVAGAAEAYNAYVLDAWDNLWCAARHFDAVYQEDLVAIVQAATESKGGTLQRGAKLDTCLPGPKGHSYLRTYGSCYVVVLRFGGAFDETKARDVVSAALPRIEALTLRIPPPNGPGTGSNEAVGSA